jgi:hypothetical protein
MLRAGTPSADGLQLIRDGPARRQLDRTSMAARAWSTERRAFQPTVPGFWGSARSISCVPAALSKNQPAK